MNKKTNEYLIISLLLSYSLYCSLTIGASWDEFYHYKNGDNIFKYIFSLGLREYQSANFTFHYGLYDFLASFFSKNFTKNLIVESHHIFNLLFSISSIYAIYQISKILFNKNIAKISFILCFLNPIYFGHFSINPKDTVISFCYSWIFYSVLKYFKNFENPEKKIKHVICLILLLTLGLSIRLTFLISLIPIFIILLFEAYRYIKSLKIKILFFDFFLIIISSFIITIIFWPDTHNNIFLDPFILVYEYFVNFFDSSFGLPYGLINGVFYDIQNTPRYYFFLSLFHKMPFYIVLSFVICIFLTLNKNFRISLFKKKNFFYLFINVFFLFFILLVFKPGINDGIRYFLYIIPYIIVVSSIAIYFLFLYSNKLIKFIIIILISYNLIIFLSLTPYQYIFINGFNGKFKNNLNRYEIDYWGTSLKELAIKIEKNKTFNENKRYKLATCGHNNDILKYYFNKYSDFKYSFVNPNEKYDYIIFVNRVDSNSSQLTKTNTCFNNYFKNEIISVTRNDLQLALISD